MYNQTSRGAQPLPLDLPSLCHPDRLSPESSYSAGDPRSEVLGVDLPGQPWGKAALIRVTGSILVALACCATLFALNGTVTRRRGLRWFAFAHFIVFFVLRDCKTLGHLGAVGLGQTAMRAPRESVRSPSGSSTCPVCNRKALHRIPPAQLRSPNMSAKFAKPRGRKNVTAWRATCMTSIKQQIFVIQTAAATAQVRFDDDQSGTKRAPGPSPPRRPRGRID